MPKAYLHKLKPGDILIADDGFGCLPPGPHPVHFNQSGQPFLLCPEGRHYIDPHASLDGSLFGLTLPEKDQTDAIPSP